MHATLSEPFDIANREIIALDANNLEEYINLAKSCFPDWDAEEKYARMFFDFGKKKVRHILKTPLLVEDSEVIAFGSMIIASDLKLAYLHNFGTRTDSRNKGCFSDIVKTCLNIALENDVKEAYAIVENGSDSHRALHRLDFDTKDTFHLYHAK